MYYVTIPVGRASKEAFTEVPVRNVRAPTLKIADVTRERDAITDRIVPGTLPSYIRGYRDLRFPIFIRR